MKLLHVISILLLLAGTGLAEDIIFFADDHYKSLGQPELTASVANPALVPGDSILRIYLADAGELEELMPINESGSNEDILLEMEAEMHSCDAFNISAALRGTGPIKVTTGPQLIKILPAGAAAMLQFNITAMKNASGWYALPLSVDYERQVDVSVKSSEVFPLYEAERQNLTGQVFLVGDNQTLRISGIKSDLYAGGSESLRMAISNEGATLLHNCSAKLLAAPPFYVESPATMLGDLAPGSLAVIAFTVRVDGNAGLQDYQLGCEIDCQEKSIIVPLQIPLSRAGILGNFARPALGGLAIAGLAAFLIWKRGDQLFRRKKRRRQM
ncbi:MAG: hypothetical protein M0Q43_00440 [Methanothrix sp.]|jgi:hypothetical protein|nr:hypothetical protein [Methanothrix sp.]